MLKLSAFLALIAAAAMAGVKALLAEILWWPCPPSGLMRQIGVVE